MLMELLRRHGLKIPALFVCFVFIQSLFFKFTRSVETIYIFEEKLDPWAASLGFPGAFAPGGIFSAYVVGSMELVASTLILVGLFSGKRALLGLGALLGVGVMSGAIFFHLFTPLGVAVRNADGSFDGIFSPQGVGELFTMACIVWLSCVFLAFRNKDAVLGLLGVGRQPAMA